MLRQGPGSTFYVASTFRGKVLAFESQSDDSVILSDATYMYVDDFIASDADGRI